MSVAALPLKQALVGPFITLYGHPVLGVQIDSSQSELDGEGLGFASIVGFRLGGLGCTHLPRPVLIPLPGPGKPLEHPECGFQPGEILKWSVPAGSSLVALSSSQGEASTLLPSLAAGAAHDCECKGAPAALGAAGADAITQEFNACISVTVNNNQVCLDIPIYGKVCIPIPISLPSGTAAEACIDVCKKWGVPCGVKVTVSVLGRVVASKGFGCC
jgi:hypothetical protein